MPDNNRRRPPEDGEESPPPEKSGVPASLIFMEMMRQAAAKPTGERTENERPATGARPRDIHTGFPQPSTELRPTAGTSMDSAAMPESAAVEVAQEAVEPQTPLEVQRIRRVKRRKAKRRSRTVGTIAGLFRTVVIVVIAAGLLATIFTWWTSPDFLNHQVRTDLQVALATNQASPQPTGLPTPNWMRLIGIVSGHHGPQNDPGAVCPDGLEERSINETVATMVVRNLRGLGYSVDLLDEFDPRLTNFWAAALVSIHSNTCQDWGGEVVSGFLVAKADSRPAGGEDDRLAECIAQHYSQQTKLTRRTNLTVDMTNYHSFREIHPLTPAAIIELGFMKADRDLLTGHPDLLARGITDGILCFLEPGPDGRPNAPLPEPTAAS